MAPELHQRQNMRHVCFSISITLGHFQVFIEHLDFFCFMSNPLHGYICIVYVFVYKSVVFDILKKKLFIFCSRL